jgi:hypothetical protein
MKRLFTVLLLLVSTLPHSANAQAGGSPQMLQQMFSNISKDTNWDMSRDMLWGYFFTNPSRQPLEAASKDLARSGYRVVDIYLGDKDSPTAPDQWWLHVERVETHSVASLFQRNAELATFAKEHALATYDGMDVGPIAGAKK